MSTNNGWTNYYCEGFSMVISPGHVCAVCIYFRFAGGVINLKGCDAFNKDKSHVGFVYPYNISVEVSRAMRAYLKAHTSRWVRVHG